MNQASAERPIELVAIMNSFNRRSLLERAVNSLTAALRTARFGSTIIVFEAGSNDGSSEFLKTWRDEHAADNLMLIEGAPEHRSFSEGVNIACAAACARFRNCRWLFLFETDNWLANVDPVEKAVALLRSQSQLAATGFTVKQHDGKFFGYGMRFPSALSFVLGQNLAGPLNLHAPNNSAWRASNGIRWRTCDVVFTSPLLIRREAWEQSGGFDAAAFPFSDSDLDWAWRCAKLGWKMAVIACEDVVHDNLEQLSAWSAKRALDFHRNRLRLLRRHRGHYVDLIKPILFARHCAEILVLSARARSDSAATAKLAQRQQMLKAVWNNYS